MNVETFLRKAMGALFANKAARDYMLQRIGLRDVSTISQNELATIIQEAIEIARKSKING